MSSSDPREQMPAEISWLPDLVLRTLGERLDQALGQDPWSLGHRAAAFAFSAKLLTPGYVRAFLATNDGVQHQEVGAILLRYMQDSTDPRVLDRLTRGTS